MGLGARASNSHPNSGISGHTELCGPVAQYDLYILFTSSLVGTQCIELFCLICSNIPVRLQGAASLNTLGSTETKIPWTDTVWCSGRGILGMDDHPSYIEQFTGERWEERRWQRKCADIVCLLTCAIIFVAVSFATVALVGLLRLLSERGANFPSADTFLSQKTTQ